MRVCAAKNLAGRSIWSAEGAPTRVLAAIPTVGDAVTLLINAGGRVERMHAVAEDGFRVADVATLATFDDLAVTAVIYRWQKDRGARCCDPFGPFCEASIESAYRHVREAVDVIFEGAVVSTRSAS